MRSPAPLCRHGAGCTHTEHPNVRSGPYLFHEGQRFPFRDWDCAEDHSPWGGQCLTNSLYEGLTEELHLPNLIDDTHSLPWATAGTCLRMTKTVTGTAEAHAAQSPTHSPAAVTPESQAHSGRHVTSQPTRDNSLQTHLPWRLSHPENSTPRDAVSRQCVLQ